MIIKNWMQTDPLTIESDMLASEAMTLFDKHNIPFIPVVDDGRLRGLLARRDIREAASCVTAAQNIHELRFFNTQLKVKDLMVRKPETLSVNDTVETALIKGKKFGRSFFPVMDGESVCGTVSDIDIYTSLYQILGADEKTSGISLEYDHEDEVSVKELVADIDAAGGAVHSIFRMRKPKSGQKRLLLRFKAENQKKAMEAVKAKGYRIVEMAAHE